jgi:hypothetical protein
MFLMNGVSELSSVDRRLLKHCTNIFSQNKYPDTGEPLHPAGDRATGISHHLTPDTHPHSRTHSQTDSMETPECKCCHHSPSIPAPITQRIHTATTKLSIPSPPHLATTDRHTAPHLRAGCRVIAHLLEYRRHVPGRDELGRLHHVTTRLGTAHVIAVGSASLVSASSLLTWNTQRQNSSARILNTAARRIMGAKR